VEPQSIVALGKATSKPGDIFWAKAHQTSAGSADGMQRQGSMSPWSAYTGRTLGGSGERGSRWMSRRDGGRG